MAPEVLDGAVNLRECEASLKEIDVYAMSIVLWEVGMRWSDIYGSKFLLLFCLLKETYASETVQLAIPKRNHDMEFVVFGSRHS